MSSKPALHAIRLHGPWSAEVIDCWFPPGSSLVGTSFECTIPNDWTQQLGSDFRGRVAYRRGFGCPASLTPSDRVWIFIEEVDYRGHVWLGDRELGHLQFGGPPLRAEITEILLPRNQLRIDVELPVEIERACRYGQSGGIIGGVRLEIESREA